jgi:hypothetical protein
MVNNDSTNLSSGFIKTLMNFFKSFLKNIRQVTSKYPNTMEIIQLSFIYSFAVIDLIHGILSNVFALGYFPEILRPIYPFLKAILLSPLLQVLASPEKIFFLSYVAIELIIVKSVFKFSKLIKYNVLLIFALLMIQGLIIAYWDLLFHREIATGVARWIFDDTGMIFTDKRLAVLFFLLTFVLFMLLYFYLFLRAIAGKFVLLPSMEWLTDSIAFWLRIKTPTMRFGSRKKDDKNKRK